MIKKIENAMIKVNKPVGSYDIGFYNIKMHDGIPAELFWRERFKDAKRDHCVEFALKLKAIKSGGTELVEPLLKVEKAKFIPRRKSKNLNTNKEESK